MVCSRQLRTETDGIYKSLIKIQSLFKIFEEEQAATTLINTNVMSEEEY
jgi:hypothetical protein